MLALFLAAALTGPAPAPDPYADLAVELLQRYLQIDTTVPPGNELRAARFYQEVLEREGIPVEVDEFAPGRANLLATLKGSGARRSLILSNHMDVVPADASRWSVPPFSGARKDGAIWGRGAQDMKTEGILQLLALVRLRREGVELDRDVLFLGTSGEEVDFAGALRALQPEAWRERLARAEFLITEGGENLEGASGEPLYFAINTGEKGALWLTLRTTGTPGHGSRPIADSALNRLVRALERVRQHRTSMKLLPSVEVFLKDQAARLSGPRALLLRDPRAALAEAKSAAALYDDREASPLLRNTISITVVRAGYKTNVIPGTAEAELDVRLLPGESPDAFLAELRGVIDDPTVEVVPPQQFWAPNQSPIDAELPVVVRRVLSRHFPGVPVTTSLLTGATESVLFRALGVAAYGFTPLVASQAEIDSVHGDDERVSEATLRRSTAVFYEVVKELCAPVK